ncbi:MAG: transposase [Galactobacter sp.]
MTGSGTGFTTGVKVATSDAFDGYKNAIDAKLGDAAAVLDAFHVIKRGFAALDEVHRRVQQATLRHRGRRGDPLYGIRHILTTGANKLTDTQYDRFRTALAANPEVHKKCSSLDS